MKSHLALIVLVAAAMPLAAQPTAEPPALTLEQSTALRCSAAFALVADGQARGEEGARGFPPMAERGREFFVRTSAQLMDETGRSREDVAALLQAEAQRLRDSGTTGDLMPACLLLLDASGL